MNILISNDDGYDKIGIEIARKILSKYGNVYVSAPSCQSSGSSVRISPSRNIEYIEIDDKTIAVKSSPADSVFIGFKHFKNVRFDLVVSGINNGYNQAKDILLSGTIGAGIMGAFTYSKVLCLSAQADDFDRMEEKAEKAIDFYFKNNLMNDYPFLNINFPDKGFDSSKGFKLGKIYPNPLPEKSCRMDPFFKEEEYEIVEIKDSDRYYTAHGYYSITPLKTSIEDTELSSKLENYLENIRK